MIYITGSSGFIGRHLTQKLDDYDIPWKRLERNIKNNGWLELNIPIGSVCFHLAANNSLKSSTFNPEVTIIEAKNLACALLEMNFSKIIFSSSGVVYGSDSINAYQEKDKSSTSTHPYLQAKLVVEKLLIEHGHLVVRLANVYGGDMDKNNVLSDILKQLPNKKTLVLRDGSCIRDFVHVSDVIDGLVKLERLNKNGVYNLGSGVGVSIYELAKSVLELSGEGHRDVLSLQQKKVMSSVILDSSKLSVECNWKPKISLCDGIRELLVEQ